MNPETAAAELERVFDSILHERMRGMPVLNPALAVKAVGFRDWHGDCLGVLITPWFMNLVLLPHDAAAGQTRQPGDKLAVRFPSGAYEFIVNAEAALGTYLSCSLFSPMFDFADQQAAEATAAAVMEALMDADNQEAVSMREQEIARIWRGEPQELTTEEAQQELAELEQQATLTERMATPLTRRALLRGQFFRADDGR